MTARDALKISDRITAVAVAAIGLAGTLAAAYVGYRQWRMTRRDSGREDFLKTRRQTYHDLWRMVETVHTDLRLEPEQLSILRKQIADVNSYILMNEVYLGDDDHRLVDAYLRALGEMVSWAQREGDFQTQRPYG